MSGRRLTLPALRALADQFGGADIPETLFAIAMLVTPPPRIAGDQPVIRPKDDRMLGIGWRTWYYLPPGVPALEDDPAMVEQMRMVRADIGRRRIGLDAVTWGDGYLVTVSTVFVWWDLNPIGDHPSLWETEIRIMLPDGSESGLDRRVRYKSEVAARAGHAVVVKALTLSDPARRAKARRLARMRSLYRQRRR